MNKLKQMREGRIPRICKLLDEMKKKSKEVRK